jgi:tRNA nucleotidyltransferase (CCA-adding enzyme)
MTPAATIDGQAVLARVPALAGGAPLLAAARQAALPAYLVGGAVRDIALGAAPRELDVAVDGDPSALVAALGGAATVHDRFGTACVDLDDGAAVDVARTRSETYSAPGALPDVAPAPIDDDLRRRDATVNAIAVDLRDGTLHAAPGALDDLAAGTLRVLHDRSFVDDPTRLWRFARYAVRLGFTVDKHTRALAAGADPSTVSGPRLGAELRLALREPDPVATLRAAGELNARLLPRGFAPADGADALALLDGEGRADLVVLAASTVGMDVSELLAWLNDLAFTAEDRDLVAVASRASTGTPLRAARTPSQIARAARGAPVEAVALAGGDNARRWLHELRRVALHIDGRDLLAAGIAEGPEIGARLQRTLDRVLDGEISGTRDAELAAALGGGVDG